MYLVTHAADGNERQTCRWKSCLTWHVWECHKHHQKPSSCWLQNLFKKNKTRNLKSSIRNRNINPIIYYKTSVVFWNSRHEKNAQRLGNYQTNKRYLHHWNFTPGTSWEIISFRVTDGKYWDLGKSWSNVRGLHQQKNPTIYITILYIKIYIYT